MLLYNQVGQYELSLSHASGELSDRGICTVGETRIQALYKSKKIRSGDTEFGSVIDACEKVGEPVFAHLVRTYLARSYVDERRFIEAIVLLRDHYDEVLRTQYPPLISTYDALLAHLYRETGDAVLARRFALRAIDSAVKNAYTEPLANAYRLMYVLSKEQGDLKSALSFHEKYTAVDKGYLDDVSARQLAYQRVKHEVDASKLEIDALNKQNEVLQLQQELSKKAVENIRLYIALLVVTLIFIALWAYKTKRSQMHFKKLSRRDGLTGIFNRPHFIDLCESTLKSARKNRQDVCIVLCDLDHFKAVNDNYGHAEGDYVLQRAVTACQMYLRANDVFARIGGEEFGVLLPACNLEDARVRAERLRQAVVDSNPSDGKFKVSASFGIACSSKSGYDLQTLMTHADAALYQAKRSGRNCVMAYDGNEGEAVSPRVVYVEGVQT
jgi:diguanylate cyclase (GGDEF)-like protein